MGFWGAVVLMVCTFAICSVMLACTVHICNYITKLTDAIKGIGKKR